LFDQIQERALATAIAAATVEEIDRLNIFQATLLAMQRAVSALVATPAQVLVDGNACPVLDVPVRAVVRGDALVPAISAASILAKVARDRQMHLLHAAHPAWGFDIHKGYPTPKHLAALRLHGASPVHRRSFAPVARVLGETVHGH
jgi:ribonuclease HII